jgi:hypothetical protein
MRGGGWASASWKLSWDDGGDGTGGQAGILGQSRDGGQVPGPGGAAGDGVSIQSESVECGDEPGAVLLCAGGESTTNLAGVLGICG